MSAEVNVKECGSFQQVAPGMLLDFIAHKDVWIIPERTEMNDGMMT